MAHPEVEPHRIHSIDIEPSPGRVRILAGETVIADTDRALLLHETGHTVRAYIPRDDIRASVEPSDKTSFCPFKGDASYWTVAGVENAAWSYEDPKAEVGEIRGLLAFYPDRVGVEIAA
jgi:uncharacterized protein (DUF427 family)